MVSYLHFISSGDFLFFLSGFYGSRPVGVRVCGLLKSCSEQGTNIGPGLHVARHRLQGARVCFVIGSMTNVIHGISTPPWAQHFTPLLLLSDSPVGASEVGHPPALPRGLRLPPLTQQVYT